MSGRKVLRIKTKAERQAEAHAWISRVQAAARRWQDQAGAAGLATAADIDATAARADELSGLLAADRFDAVEQQARQEIAFLAQDLERRRQAETARHAQRRKRNRRLADAAASLQAALRETGKPVPASLAATLAQAASGAGKDDDAAALEAALAQALDILAEPAATEPAATPQAGLAARLQTPTTAVTLADWLAAQQGADEPAATAVDTELARIEVEAGAALAAPFAARARAIAAAPADARRRLLYDSLRLDLAAALKDWRSRQDARDALATLAAELADIQTGIQANPDAATLQRAIEHQLTAPSPDTAAITELRARTEAWLADHRAAAALTARRDAMLAGLAAIGYEVREGMAGLWQEGGRLLLRRGSSPDTGVELTGHPTTARLQLRAVGLPAAPDQWDHTRDRDIEQRFCDDLQALGGRLEQQGIDLVIERATPAGTQALRTLDANDPRRDTEQAAGEPVSERSLEHRGR